MNGMRLGALFALTLMLVAPLSAAPPRKAAPRPPPVPKVIQSCDAHKFETVVDTTVDGQPRKSKVKLCGVEGQSDAEWIGTMRDAIRKLEANKEMAPATRDQIIAAIKAEIGRLSIVGSPIPAKREAQGAISAPLSRDYATLPPLPAVPEPSTAPAASPPPLTQVPAEPAASVAPVAVPAPSVPQPTPVLAVPRLTIDCETPNDLAGLAPCAEFERETRLTIAAEGTVPAGTALQFVRNGRTQAELALDGITKGAPLRTALPSRVCAGFGAGRLELRVLQAGGVQAVQSEGPYSLRC